MRKQQEGASKKSLHPVIESDNDCIDVMLAGIRIRIDYFDGNKEFFVGVGAPNQPFSGYGRVPIGELYDALKPLTRSNQ